MNPAAAFFMQSLPQPSQQPSCIYRPYCCGYGLQLQPYHPQSTFFAFHHSSLPGHQPLTTPSSVPGSALPAVTALLGPLLPAVELAQAPFCNMHLLGLVLAASLHAAKPGTGMVLTHLPFSIKSIIVRRPRPGTDRSCASQSDTLGSAGSGLSPTTALSAFPWLHVPDL
ncbi:hypothetical protein HGM15179_018644 [Zosterops borbonicus]|uniref:Uncharacterized protein n=1 Tax=Zosterops borbonicus TaxID=364589 RepID=A0A8K1DB87_9PASS|nr:hypothetical protein HGM15179_018644 [Zosterops borbonicus]